jgi:hypothetical protein
MGLSLLVNLQTISEFQTLMQFLTLSPGKHQEYVVWNMLNEVTCILEASCHNKNGK